MRQASLALAVGWVLALCGACSERCHDADGDGRGAGCERGPDCDDHDPTRTSACDAAAADCEAQPGAEGCPCLAGEQVACYPAPSETRDVGVCHGGMASCGNGTYTGCEGAVLPEVERCNEIDDDCDGIVDDGVRSPCGGCNDECIGGVWGAPQAPFLKSGDLDVTAAGELTLRRNARDAATLWVPNTDEGTVSKVDVTGSVEVARYRTLGAAPIAVAVDRLGDAWLLDRATDGRASVTKIAGDVSRCLAADGGATITSTSPGDVLAWGKDDCVVFGAPVGGASDGARCLAIDGALTPDGEPVGHAWVGLADAHELIELDAADGSELDRVALGKLSPTAAAFDPWGTLWLVDRAGLLARVQTAERPAQVDVLSVPLACYTLDDLAIDAQGRVLLTAGDCESVIVYEPWLDRFRELRMPGHLTPRSAAFVGDEAWVSFASGELGRIGQEPFEVLDTSPLSARDATPFDSHAIASTDDDRVWVASALGGADGRGLLTAFDVSSGEVASQLEVGVGPRARGDMSGASVGGEFVPSAQTSQVFRGCGHENTGLDAGTPTQPTEWRNVYVSAIVGPDAELVVSARHGASAGLLASARFRALGSLPADRSPFAIDFPADGLVEVQLELRSHGALGAPRVAYVGVEWRCAGPE